MKRCKMLLAAMLCIQLGMQQWALAAGNKALEEQNSAYLNMYPQTKTFAQATLLDSAITNVDRIELSSGNTGQKATILDTEQIQVLYQSLRGLTLTRSLYQQSSSCGYALNFYDDEQQVAVFISPSFGTLAQRIDDQLAVTYGLSDTEGRTKFNQIVQPYFARELLAENKNVSQWARAQILSACEQGVVPDRLAGGNLQEPISRWKFCEIMEMLLERKIPTVSPKPINDCPYEGYVCEVTVWRYGLLEGRDDGFASDAILTRQECATILSRTLELYQKSPDTTRSFTDMNTAAPWARNAVQKCGTLFSGDTDGRFRPAAEMTAEEAIIVIQRLYNMIK